MLSIGFVHQSGSSLPGLTFRSDEGIQEYEILCYVCVCVRACVRACVCVCVCVCVWGGGGGACVRERESRVFVCPCMVVSILRQNKKVLVSYTRVCCRSQRQPGTIPDFQGANTEGKKLFDSCSSLQC